MKTWFLGLEDTQRCFRPNPSTLLSEKFKKQAPAGFSVTAVWCRGWTLRNATLAFGVHFLCQLILLWGVTPLAQREMFLFSAAGPNCFLGVSDNAKNALVIRTCDFNMSWHFCSCRISPCIWYSQDQRTKSLIQAGKISRKDTCPTNTVQWTNPVSTAHLLWSDRFDKRRAAQPFCHWFAWKRHWRVDPAESTMRGHMSVKIGRTKIEDLFWESLIHGKITCSQVSLWPLFPIAPDNLTVKTNRTFPQLSLSRILNNKQ